MKSSRREDAIIKTLAYSDIFDFPLKLSEIHTFLHSRQRVSRREIQKTLRRMQDTIGSRDGYYFFLGRGKTVSLRKNREKESRKKLARARRIAALLSRLPTIQLLGISGSLAVSNCKKDDDIDFFVITRKNTLWLTRLFMTLVLFVLKEKRKRGASSAEDKICPNMYVSEDSLQFDSTMQNIFVAREITQLVPLINRKNTYEKMIQCNPWLAKHLFNAIASKKSLKDRASLSKHLISTVLLPLECIAFSLQYTYMKRHMSRETVSYKRIMFHPEDKKSPILREFRKRYRQYRQVRPHYSRILTYGSILGIVLS